MRLLRFGIRPWPEPIASLGMLTPKMPNRRSLMLAFLLLAGGAHAASDLVDACLGVLSQGIFDTYNDTTTAGSYMETFASFCNASADYTLTQYEADTQGMSSTDSSKGVEASYDLLGVAAAGIVEVLGKFGSKKRRQTLTQTQFKEAMAYISARQSIDCGESGFEAATASATSNLATIVNPAIVNAYVECLKLGNFGIIYSSPTGVTSVDVNSFTNSVKFVQPSDARGAKATLTAIIMSPPRSAQCSVSGTDVFKTIFDSADLQIKMPPQATFTIVCAVSGTFSNETSDQAKGINIDIVTSPGGSFHKTLFRSAEPTALTAVKSEVTSLKATRDAQQIRIDQLIEQVAELQKLQSLPAQVTELQSLPAQVTDLQNRLAQLTAQITALGVDSDGRIPVFKADVVQAKSIDVGTLHFAGQGAAAAEIWRLKWVHWRVSWRGWRL
ncbi:hypothetical protein D9Q98_002489 [Chlorella vulgaris]|uniref:Uncharacterized protein n=1 Tax=Chlorella vulgaris TaxID=3077 RepID=A0A9D4TTF5_CHLVU|nr:hypothetical protein D9Q98_002489 [Chlorella vulgaris]